MGDRIITHLIGIEILYGKKPPNLAVSGLSVKQYSKGAREMGCRTTTHLIGRELHYSNKTTRKGSFRVKC
jgi:hypothetical protein